jgi:hypothetical protein
MTPIEKATVSDKLFNYYEQSAVSEKQRNIETGIATEIETIERGTKSTEIGMINRPIAAKNKDING